MYLSKMKDGAMEAMSLQGMVGAAGSSYGVLPPEIHDVSATPSPSRWIQSPPWADGVVTMSSQP